VVGVVAQSPSAAAGVRIGDVIESMDGTDIADGNVLLQVLAKKQAGDQVKLGVRRESRSLVLEVKLARREALFEFEER
jgi:S1-C subfamily serine protease